MIKNIVFDMGKVLVEYEGDRVCRHFSEDEALIRKVSTAVFVSPEWLMLDMGIISEEEGLSQILTRLDTEEEKELARKSFAHWHEYNMYHKEGMEELVRELKEEGYRIYLCSNASVRLLTCYHQVIPAIDCFDGIFDHDSSPYLRKKGCRKPVSFPASPSVTFILSPAFQPERYHPDKQRILRSDYRYDR